MPDGTYMLIDLDAAAKIGKEKAGVKFSSAFSAPELAQYLFMPDIHEAPIAHPSLDIWALGVLLYEICSSQHLFPRNFTNDNVTDPAVKCRLCTWHTMSDEQLKEVYEQLVNKGT